MVIDTFAVEYTKGISLAVSAQGMLAIYKSNSHADQEPQSGDTTVVTLLSPDFSVISEEVHADYREIVQSMVTGDSVTAVIACNTWAQPKLMFFDE